jgi:hypothetical protein
MWKESQVIGVSREAARTSLQHNTIQPIMIEIVLNHIQQQNGELTFTQIPQPIQSSSEMKAIFD